ncbi:MAG: pseudouridine synthase [Candidatus Hydrogenedentes bacterium]|nr:pseudouridine synthase [Candidatus Hydrogenedentota bacterium]
MSAAEMPVRISKLLSERGICSRREADDFIARGLVLVDGTRVAQLGERVLPTQSLALDPRARGELGEQVTVLLNKPLGYVSGQAEEGYTPAVALIGADSRFARDRSPLAFTTAHLLGLAPAGRLDIDSTGLLVLTQNGTIAKQLVGGEGAIEKEYLVRVTGAITPNGLRLLNHGLELDRRVLRPAKVTQEGPGELRFILWEGRKRQIRRMCNLVGLDVVALKRIRIGKVRLGNLPYGRWRYLAPNENF